MSDTPKTDAVAKRYEANEIGAAEVLSYAGQLERDYYEVIKLMAHLECDMIALRAELGPLREIVGVAATASTCADDLSNWSKLVERADNSKRLEQENATLREALQSAENGLRHGLMMEPLDPFKRGKIISEALDVVRAARKEAQP